MKCSYSTDVVLRDLSARLIEGCEMDRPEEEERPVAVERKNAEKDCALLRGGRTFAARAFGDGFGRAVAKLGHDPQEV